MTISRVIAIVAVVAVVVIVALALREIGPPARARAEALDRQRVSDLGRLAADLHDDYARNHAELPATYPYNGDRTDPATGKSYEYRRLSKNDYEVCAVFELPTPQHDPNNPTPLWPFWRHPAGHYCYHLDVRRQVDSTL